VIGRLNHIAIVVPDLEAAANQYRTVLGASVTNQKTYQNMASQLFLWSFPTLKWSYYIPSEIDLLSKPF